MKTSIKLLLAVAAVFSAAQLANSSFPADYPTIPSSPQYDCLRSIEKFFVKLVDKFLNTYNSVTSGATVLTLNLINDIANSANHSGISIVTILLNAINSGSANGGVIAASVCSVIIQGLKTQITELYQAVTNILGYLGTTGPDIQANLIATLKFLGALLTKVLDVINNFNISVEKLACCLPKYLPEIDTSEFTKHFLVSISIVVQIAEEISSGSAVTQTLVDNLQLTTAELPAATDNLINLFIKLIKCSKY